MAIKTDIQTTINNARKWGLDRNLHGPESKSTVNKQYQKLEEEASELLDGIICKDPKLIADSIGDMTVVLIQMAEQAKEIFKGTEFEGYNFEDCLRYSYNEIKNRTGKTVDGVYVKDQSNG